VDLQSRQTCPGRAAWTGISLVQPHLRTEEQGCICCCWASARHVISWWPVWPLTVLYSPRPGMQRQAEAWPAVAGEELRSSGAVAPGADAAEPKRQAEALRPDASSEAMHPMTFCTGVHCQHVYICSKGHRTM